MGLDSKYKREKTQKKSSFGEAVKPQNSSKKSLNLLGSTHCHNYPASHRNTTLWEENKGPVDLFCEEYGRLPSYQPPKIKNGLLPQALFPDHPI